MRPKRRRRVGVFLVTSFAATVAVVAGTLIVISQRPATASDPLGMVVAEAPAGQAGQSLVAARQQLIADNLATTQFVISSPKISVIPPPQQAAPLVTAQVPDPATNRGIAYSLLTSFGFSTSQWSCLDDLWQRESDWETEAENPSGAYGIPQALPGDKMASVASDWRTDPTTQIKWGLGYIKSVYGTPCAAWDHELADNSY